jgi:hypothetical protein
MDDADVTVSVDGHRRIDPIDLDMDGYLSARYGAVQERVGNYGLTLADTTTDGSDYSPDAVYELGITASLPLVCGDLGPFWGGEMSWSTTRKRSSPGPCP